MRAPTAFVLSLAIVAGMPAEPGDDVGPPAPYGPLPSPRQLRWHEMEFYGFLHFTDGRDARFVPRNVIDGRGDTYWATSDTVTTPDLILDLGRATTFNVVRLREYLPLGQRIEAFALEQWRGGGWEPFARGTSVGSTRLVRTGRITTSRLRLRITQAPVSPALSELGLFLEPES